MEFSGKNISEVLKNAAKHFGVDETFISYNLVDSNHSSGGLFSRLFSRGIKIEAWVEKKEEDLKAAAREAVRQVLEKNLEVGRKPQEKKLPEKRLQEKRSQERSSSQNHQRFEKQNGVTFKDLRAENLLQEYNTHFFKAFDLTEDQYSYEINQDGDLNVAVHDENFEKILTKTDKLSLAYEHLLKRLAQKKVDEVSSRVFLQAGESAAKHKERLHAMALGLAEKVKKTGHSVTLSSKSSAERRIIHMALDTIPGVKTRSIGSGDQRKLIIYLEDHGAKRKNSEKNQQNNSNRFKRHKRNSSQENSPKT